MSDERFEFGDRVRNAKRPEWGIGSVVKAENVTVNGRASQRLSVRFPGVGVKVLNTAQARLQHVADQPAGLPGDPDADDHPVRVWDKVGRAEWLAPVAQRKIEQAMISLPVEARDPFNGLGHRLEVTLGLYRFDRTGAGLIQWALAQTGLDDPLSRFSRHELEQFFDRWAFERDAHLQRLIEEAGRDQRVVESALAQAPPAAKAAVQRITAVP